jgi:hypothetical protein
MKRYGGGENSKHRPAVVPPLLLVRALLLANRVRLLLLAYK